MRSSGHPSVRRIIAIAGIGAFLISGGLFVSLGMQRFAQGFAYLTGRALKGLSNVVDLVSAASTPGPQKAQDAPSRNSAQAQSLRRFLQDNYAADSGYPDVKTTTRYASAFVHLRDDNTQQVVVYLVGPAWCGTGGCFALILVPTDSSYTVLTEMTVAQQPIRLLRTKSHGWHDLGVWVQGGGIQPGYEARLSFDGKGYPSNPTVPPAQRLAATAEGEVIVWRTTTGEPLYPTP